MVCSYPYLGSELFSSEGLALKFERDKWYRTRRGEKMRVVCTDAPGKFPIICHDELGDIRRRYEDGFYCASRGESSLDLIAEWREPVKGEGRFWCNDLGQPVWPVGCQLPDRLRGSVLLRDVLFRYEEIPE